MDSLLEQVTGKSDLHAILDRSYTKRVLQPSLKCITVLTNLQPEALEKLGGGPFLRRYKFTVKKLEKDLFRVRAEKRIGTSTSEALFLVIVNPGSWVILTRERKNITEGLIESFLNALYPSIVRIYLNSIQLRELLAQTGEAYKGELDMTFIAYTESLGGSSRRIAIRGEKLEAEHIKYLNRIEFLVRGKPGYVSLRSVVTTRGLVRLMFGSYSDFYQRFLLPMVDFAKNWDSRYLGVRRTFGTEGSTFNSCVIKYRKQPDLEDTRRLASLITSSYTAVITHAGNPYFLAQISDSSNKASFAVNLYGDTLTIVPVFVVSDRVSASIWKLTEKIQSVLGEGEIAVS